MATQTQTRTILIKVDTSAAKGLSDIADKMGLLNKSTKSLSDNMSFLTGAFKSWLGFLGIKQLADMSDQIQLLEQQLKLITGSTQGATDALAAIAGVADRTNQSISGTGQAFVRYAEILKPVQASTQEVAALIETLTNSFRTSRVPVDGITEALLNLSQGFIKGGITGRELRTILTQNVTVANLLKQTYGGDIYKKAQEGAISLNDVMKILTANQTKINADAQALAPTFGQTLTKALNTVTLAVGNLNEQFGLSSKFAVIVGGVIDNLSGILTVFAGVVTVLALSRIPQLIESMKAARLAFLAFASSNPVLLLFTAIATAGSLIYEYWSKIGPLFDSIKASFLDMAANVEEKGLAIRQSLADLTGSKTLQDQIDLSRKGIDDMRATADKLHASLTVAFGPEVPTASQKMQSSLESLQQKMKGLGQPTKSLKLQLGELNTEFLQGKITTDEYNQALLNFDLTKAVTQFKEGQIDIVKYNKALAAVVTDQVTQQFNRGKLSIDEFNKGIAETQVGLLNSELDLGTASLESYTAAIIKLKDQVRPGAAFYSGISSFIESAGTLSQGIAKVTTNAFDHLSDTLTSFIQTGKLDFASFTKAILDDLTAMLIKAAVVAPIAQGILGAFGGGASSGVVSGTTTGFGIGSPGVISSAFASGGVMSSMGAMPLNKYASGGVANSPQLAMFGEGRKPEAYVPLPDGRSIPVNMSGGSGVSVTQTIIIQSDGGIGGSTQAIGQNAKQIGDLMKQVAIDTIIKQKRQGGLLA